MMPALVAILTITVTRAVIKKKLKFDIKWRFAGESQKILYTGRINGTIFVADNGECRFDWNCDISRQA